MYSANYTLNMYYTFIRISKFRYILYSNLYSDLYVYKFIHIYTINKTKPKTKPKPKHLFTYYPMFIYIFHSATVVAII